MAQEASGGGNGLYFIVGGLVVLVGLGAYAYTGGHLGAHRSGGVSSTTTTEQTTTTTPPPPATSTTTTTTQQTQRP